MTDVIRGVLAAFGLGAAGKARGTGILSDRTSCLFAIGKIKKQNPLSTLCWVVCCFLLSVLLSSWFVLSFVSFCF